MTPPVPRVFVGLLVASLLGNAALWALLQRRPASAVASASSAPARSAPLPSARPAPVPTPFSPEAAAALSHALGSDSLEAFRDLLVASGIDPKLRRELLHVMLQHRYAPRFREVYFENEDIDQTPWWLNPDFQSRNDMVANRERMQRGRELQRAFEAELRELTGEDPNKPDFDENPWLKRQYAGLPREKAEALHRLQQDYDELEQEVRMETMSFELPSDLEKIRLLREERERDIAELLTPEERATWELTASPTANRTRDLATRYKATEEEYHRIFALQKAFDERFNFEDLDYTSRNIDWEAHHHAQQELEKQVRAIVGEERYLAAQREYDSDYRIAVDATARLGLPAETAERIHALRTPVAEESGRIAADTSLSPEQKRDALLRLAAQTRAAVERELGQEAAEAYFKRGGMAWLQSVESGSRISIVNGQVETHDIGLISPNEPTLPPRPPLPNAP